MTWSTKDGLRGTIQDPLQSISDLHRYEKEAIADCDWNTAIAMQKRRFAIERRKTGHDSTSELPKAEDLTQEVRHEEPSRRARATVRADVDTEEQMLQSFAIQCKSVADIVQFEETHDYEATKSRLGANRLLHLTETCDNVDSDKDEGINSDYARMPTRTRALLQVLALDNGPENFFTLSGETTQSEDDEVESWENSDQQSRRTKEPSMSLVAKVFIF